MPPPPCQACDSCGTVPSPLKGGAEAPAPHRPRKEAYLDEVEEPAVRWRCTRCLQLVDGPPDTETGDG